jgi:hypothetical protein
VLLVCDARMGMGIRRFGGQKRGVLSGRRILDVNSKRTEKYREEQIE